MKNRKTIFKAIKIAITSALGVGAAWCIYAIIAGMVFWATRQPRYTLPDGGTTTSLGIVVQSCIIGGVLLVMLIAILVTSYYFYIRPKRKAKKEQV